MNTFNATGETAFTYALKSGVGTDLVRFLKEAGARNVIDGNLIKSHPVNSVPSIGMQRQEMVRHSVQRAIDLMQRSSEQFLQRQESCSSCHHQFLPAMAYAMGRERGLSIDLSALGHQLHAQINQMQSNANNGIIELAFGGFAGAKGLIGLASLGYEVDETVIK